MPRPTRRSVPWRRDLEILHRLEDVERLHLQQLPNTAIAERLGVTESTIRLDLRRIQSNSSGSSASAIVSM